MTGVPKEIRTSGFEKLFLILTALFCLFVSGTVTHARSADLQNEVVVLTLEDALVSERVSYLQIHLQIEEGTVVRAFAFSPWYSDMAHEVDASGVTVSDDGVAGMVSVSVRSDNWGSSEKNRLINATYTIEAVLSESSGIEGSYSGTFKDDPIEGVIEGYIEKEPFTNSGDTAYVDFWIDEPFHDSRGLGKTAAIRHPIRLSIHAAITNGTW